MKLPDLSYRCGKCGAIYGVVYSHECQQSTLLPFTVRFTGPSMDISYQLKDLNDVDLALQITQKIAKCFKEIDQENERKNPLTESLRP